MNKRMIVLIALVVAVVAVPASAETLEVRGTIAELDAANPTIAASTTNPLYVSDAYHSRPGFQWDYSTFPGFWCDPDDDLQTETLTILAKERDDPTRDTLSYPDDREIGEGSLVYTTHPVFQEYELYIDKGLTVGGDTGYFLEGWMGEAYVAIDGNADKLCKLLVEFEDDDTKTLSTGEEWNLSGGFALEVTGIDTADEKATIHLSKNGDLLATGTLDTSGSEQDRVYTYTADIGGETDIPVFSCYVNAISGENDTVELMYVFLIDDDVLEIETAQTYGAMEVLTASSMEIVLKNDETAIDLGIDNTEHIMGNMYFKTADDDVNDHIRFYPMVEYTEPGTYEVRGTIAELDAGNPTVAGIANTPDGFQWDYSSFAGFWYDPDDDLQTETMTILSKERDAPAQDTLKYPGDREIGEGSLRYETHPVFQEYEMHQDIPDTSRDKAKGEQTDMEAAYDGDGFEADGITVDPDDTVDLLDQDIGLCVESDNPGGDCGYFLEGWMGEKYVAIDDNADKLCKLLLEFEDDDKKTLTIGEKWDLGGGFALELIGIDDDGNNVMLQLSKNNVSLDMEEASTGTIDRPQERVYTYTADIGGEKNIPVFSCYVDAVFKGSPSYVQLMYVFLIDDDVVKIKTSQTYGAMEVMTASSKEIVLNNDENPIDLDPGTTKNITDTMYFGIANDTSAIRFYPYVERTIGGVPSVVEETIPANVTELEIRGTIEELDAIKPTLDYDRTWNSSEFGAFWYDPDDNLCTENLTILANTLTYPADRALDENTVIYDTHPVFQEYELYENEGLTVDGDEGYYAEGWMAEKYVAIDGEADKLCKLLEEFEDDEEKILYTGEEWNLSDGFSLVASQIDLEGDNVSFTLEKNGTVIGEGTASAGEAYTYTTNISGEEDVPVFSCYADAVFRENDTNATRLMYVFLIDDDVLEIETSQIYGAMEVMTVSSNEIILTNDETTLDLDLGSTEHIMGNLYFKTADDDVNDYIRFYPMVKYTEPGTYEVRGTIVDLDEDDPTVADIANTPDGYQWDYRSFAGLWYDLDDDLTTETMTILANERDAPSTATLSYPDDREIGEGSLIYKTHPVFHEYQMHQDIPDLHRDKAKGEQTDMEAAYDGDGKNAKGVLDGSSTTDLLDRDIGLCVDSDNPGGDCGYFLEGWMGEKYVAIDDNADKLCKLLLEFQNDDKKTLTIGEKWDLGGGFVLGIMSIDDDGNKVVFQLSKNNVSLDMEVASTGAIDRPQERVYTYTADIGGERDIPVFSCYVDAVFKGNVNYVQLMYVFLIDDDVLEIDTSDTYGAMEVLTASSKEVVLNNDETTIVLDPGTTTNITDTMCFRIANDTSAIIFYPYVERTIGGGGGGGTYPSGNITDTDGDGVPDVWDADNSTPAGYWTDSDGRGRRWGDMNGDGELTSVDALMILQAAVGTIEL